MKIKSILAYVTALALTAGVVATLAVSAVADEPTAEAPTAIPTFDSATKGIRVNCFVASNGNQLGFNAVGTYCDELGKSIHAPINVLFDAPSFDDVRGIRVQFFFDWENKSWGPAGVSNPWVDGGTVNGVTRDHRISVVAQGIHSGRGVDRDWHQTNFTFVEGAAGEGEISYGSTNPVTVVIPIAPAESVDWFRATVASWSSAPGYALVHLLDEEGEVIPLMLPHCEKEDCACGGVDPSTQTPTTTPPATTRTTGEGDNPSTGVVIAIIPALATVGAVTFGAIAKRRRV